MRPRKHNRELPACMYLRSGAFYLVRKGKWLRLGRDRTAALREYARLLDAPDGAMADLIDTMFPRILRHKRTGLPKAAETQRQYLHCAELLKVMLAPLAPRDITTRDVKALRRELQDTPAIANRTLTVLRLLLDEAVEDELIDVNPAIGVEQIRMASRTRRVTVAEYDSIYANADKLLRAVMGLCYATGQRVGDVLAIRTEHVTDEGVFFEQAKTHARVIIGWTDELRDAVKAARALSPNALRPKFLFGHRAPTYAMIRKRWVKACANARVEDAHIHDIRAMAGTDADAQGIDAQRLLGHKDRRTTGIYLRDKVVPVVTGPTMKRKA